MPTMEIVEEVKPIELTTEETIRQEPKTERHIIEQYVIKRFSEENIDTSFVLDIINEESRFNTTAYNPEWHRTCQGSYGIFQIGCVNYSGNPTDLYDYKLNTELAIQVYKQQTWRAWGVCTNGKVNCGL